MTSHLLPTSSSKTCDYAAGLPSLLSLQLCISLLLIFKVQAKVGKLSLHTCCSLSHVVKKTSCVFQLCLKRSKLPAANHREEPWAMNKLNDAQFYISGDVWKLLTQKRKPLASVIFSARTWQLSSQKRQHFSWVVLCDKNNCSQAENPFASRFSTSINKQELPWFTRAWNTGTGEMPEIGAILIRNSVPTRRISRI